MSNRRVMAYVAAALVAGLVLGSFGIASAAPSKNTSGTAGLGARIGVACKAAGATMADIVAKLTGESVDEVRAQRAEGKSFATIAQDKGVSADKVVSDTLAARKALLDKAVADKQITQAQADTAYARMKANLTARVDSNAACTGAGSGACGGGGCGGAGGGMMGGRGAGACGGAGCAVTQ